MGKYVITILVGSLLFFVFSIERASADAWWGEGYRSPEWVRSHGGTTIEYTIVGAKSTKKYKAMMFRDGKYVEVEFGGNEVFDDAKNGTYVINFYKCSNSCSDHKNNKKTKIRDKDKHVGSITVIARPGQHVKIVFDAASNTARLVGRSGGIVRFDPFVAQKKAAQNNVGNTCNYQYSSERGNKFVKLMLLSRDINQEKFLAKNTSVGIVPQFLNKKSL